MDREKRIALFRNNSRQKQTDPEFRGSLVIEGKEYEFALWPAKSGKPDCWTGSVKPKTSWTQDIAERRNIAGLPDDRKTAAQQVDTWREDRQGNSLPPDDDTPPF